MDKTAVARSFIYQNQLKWFEVYKQHVSKGRVLVVGHGLGFTTEVISKINPDVIAIDVGLEPKAVLKERVTVYDGNKIPFPDNSFDSVVITYVLHHAENPALLFNEAARVSKNSIIVLEETYRNLLQKIDLAYYCWYFNRKAGQKVTIHWNSYLTSQGLKDLGALNNLRIDLNKEEPLRSYKTELFVFSK